MNNNTTITRTQSKDYGFEKTGLGACAIAAKRIAAGETVCFEAYNRNPLDSTLLINRSVHYFGIITIDHNRPAFRVSEMADLEATNSHSLIASWYDKSIVTDPVYIAAALM